MSKEWEYGHQQQALYVDEYNTVRFRENAIVRYLLDSHPNENLNTLALKNFSDYDRSQFAQLIGYSAFGFCDLSYVSDDEKDEVWEDAQYVFEEFLNERGEK